MANWSNIHDLPEPLVNAVMRDTYRREGHISVSTLIGPPQKAYLEAIHAEEITIDVSDEIYALLGSSVHAILDRAGMDNAFQEERLRVRVGDWVLTGKPDLFESDGTLTDYKVTSVYSFLLGIKSDWTAQCNTYRVLFETNGFEVKRLQIVAVLRDWMRRRIHEDGYPPAPALVKEIPLWPLERAKQYIRDRVALHRKAWETGEYPECSPEERWAKPDTWAVKKPRNKRALRVFDNHETAELLVEASKIKGEKLQIEFRPGKSTRCADGYCTAAPFCRQWAELQKEELIVEEVA